MKNKIFLIMFLMILLSYPVYALSFQDVTNFFSSIFNSISSFFNSAFSVLLPKQTATGGGGGGGGGSPSSSSSTLCSSSLSISISGKDMCTVTATVTSNNCVNRTYEVKDGGSKCNGNVTTSSFNNACTWSVTSGSYTYNLYIDGQYKLSKSVTCTKSPPPACSDGTLYGQCSSTKPKYCSSGTLINACGSPYNCRCPSLQSCNATTNSCYTPPKTCSDGTLYSSCSSNQPLYCDDGNLINACSSPHNCGCPSSQNCNTTSQACYIPVIPTATCDSTCKSQSFSSGTCEAGSSSPVGMLHACGTKLCDESGNVVYLKGVQADGNERGKKQGSTGLASSPYDSWFTADDFKRIKNAGGNVMEIHQLNLIDLMPQEGIVNVSYFTTWVDVWASWCEQYQIYCPMSIADIDPRAVYAGINYKTPTWILNKYPQPWNSGTYNQANLDFYDLSNPLQNDSRQAFINLWAFIANRYKNNKYVMFSIVNEPLCGNTLMSDALAPKMGASYSTLMGQVIDAIRSTGANQLIFIDRPYVWYFSDIQPINRNNIVWEDHVYVTPNVNLNGWEGYVDTFIQRFVIDFGKPLFIGEYGFDPITIIRTIYPNNWTSMLSSQVSYLDSKSIVGRQWHNWGYLYGEYYTNTVDGDSDLNASESNYIIQTILGGSTTTGTCQSGETSIGQDGCSSGLCCCNLTNLIQNGNFSQGFAYWGGYTGWNGSSGYVSLDYSTYHNGAPSIKLLPDPNSITPGDPAIWTDPRIPVQGEVTLKCDVWVKTDVNPNYPYNTNVPFGARMMVDFYDNSGNDLTNQGYFNIINSTVPIVDSCPVVSWGTTSWTLVEIYVKATNPNTTGAVPWLQVFPRQSGITLGGWFDDVYCAVVG